MTSLTELNELEQQVQSSQEKIQDLYSSIDYADDEVQCYVTSMVDHIAQMECLQALIALENFATRNEIQLKDLKVGTKVKDTEQSKIEATYLRKDRLWIDIKNKEVVGIYYDYQYTN